MNILPFNSFNEHFFEVYNNYKPNNMPDTTVLKVATESDKNNKTELDYDQYQSSRLNPINKSVDEAIDKAKNKAKRKVISVVEYFMFLIKSWLTWMAIYIIYKIIYYFLPDNVKSTLDFGTKTYAFGKNISRKVSKVRRRFVGF